MLMAGPVMAHPTGTQHACRALASFDPKPGPSFGLPECIQSLDNNDTAVEDKLCYCFKYGNTDSDNHNTQRFGNPVVNRTNSAGSVNGEEAV